MTYAKDGPIPEDELRARAEELVSAGGNVGRIEDPAHDATQVLHELRVHQIELELQNGELRRAQAELEASRARYVDLYDMAPIGYVTLCARGLVAEANLTAASLLGVSRSAMRRTPFSTYIAPEDQDAYYHRRRALSESGARQGFELRLTRNASERFWVWVEATAVRDASGGSAMRIAITDIGALKAAAAEKELLESRIAWAQRLDAVGQLAGGMAHDFNNMLCVILGASEMALLSLPPESPASASLREVRCAAQHGAALVSQLLAFARRQPIAPRPQDLNLTVTEMAVILGRLVREGIALAFEPSPVPCPVFVDPGQMEQALSHLTINARDAIAGEGTITISTAVVEVDAGFCATRPDAVPGSWVVLAVHDDGCGMDEETRARIFEPFFTTRPPGGGTGLGLATVYGIARQNHGFVDVESRPGEGTTFRLYLPRQEAGHPPPCAHEQPSGASRPAGETVLLVEDEPSLLLMIEKVLTSLGYHVLPAGSPGRAIELVEQSPGPIHLLLSDMVMPEMSGVALHRRLRMLRPGLRALFMSGYPVDVLARSGIAAGELDVLPKPFAMDALAERLRDALAQAPELLPG